MNMSFKEYTGKRVRTDYANINGHSVKLTAYERDVIMERLYTQGFTDLLIDPFQKMTCDEFKEFAEFAEVILD